MIATPDKEEDFSAEWVSFVLQDYFKSNEKDPELVEIVKVTAKKNEVQGILSTTFVVDVDYKHGTGLFRNYVAQMRGGGVVLCVTTGHMIYVTDKWLNGTTSVPKSICR